jgi:UDP-N-acetylglucosamine acyltransferase
VSARSHAAIHATALVDPRAELAPDVEVGPYCIVGPGVRIDEGTRLIGHVVVTGHTVLGKNNVVHPFSVIGAEPQIRKYGANAAHRVGVAAGRSSLAIGADNVFREHVTVNASSGERPTTIGAKNLFMAGAHVAHDVLVGSNCVVANAVQLAGHVIVEDWVTFGGLSGVAQHLRVGQSAFVAAGSMCERDVPPFVIVQGDRARVRALNVVGLERRAIAPESVAALRRAFAALWGRRAEGRSFDEAVAALERSDPQVRALAEWLSDPVRRIRPAKRGARA